MSNLIEQFKYFCEQKIGDFEHKVLPLSHEKHGIFLCEGFAFCALAELLNVQVIVESGVAGGLSTEICCKYFSFPILAIDLMNLYGPNLFIKTKERLKKYSHLKLFWGDSRRIIPSILEQLASSPLKIAIFIDGPKGKEAIKLAKRCFEYKNVQLVGIHDQCLHNHPTISYHQMDCLSETFMYTDAKWFFDRFSYLNHDRAKESDELRKQLKNFPQGPGIGLAVNSQIKQKNFLTIH